MKILYKISRWIHKYIGLLIAVYAVWMSVSGVLLNHPSLISGISVPQWLIPNRYMINDNWNRRALTKVLYSQYNSSRVYISGSQGVWISDNSGKNFRKMTDGLPGEPYYEGTNDLFLLGENEEKLLAATDGGLFICDLNNEKWKKVILGDEDEKIKKILHVKDELIVFGTSFAYKAKYQTGDFKFNQYQLPAPGNEERKFSLFSLIFRMHSGEIWGLPGRLVIDAVGLVLLFATLSGVYIWFVPWKKRKFRAELTKKNRRIFNWFYKYHLKIGIIFVVLILFIGISGIFLLRPLSLTILRKYVSSGYYPSVLPGNRFEDKIDNALYDKIDDRIIIHADGAFWICSTGFGTPLQKIELAKSYSSHGVCVFESLGNKGYLMGSSSGIYLLQRNDLSPTSLLPGSKGRTYITGYFKTPAGNEYAATLYSGLMPLGNADLNEKFVMPAEMIENFRWSLWSFLFSLHSGKIFSELFGSWNTAIVFSLGALFVFVTIAGTCDWLYIKVIKPKLAVRRNWESIQKEVPVLNLKKEKV